MAGSPMFDRGSTSNTPGIGSVPQENAEEAVLGGVRLRKVNVGMEILWLAGGDPRTSGGAALAAEGFEVGDVITAVDGIEALRFRSDEVLANIAFQRGGVGEVRIDGYRRVAAFPRPSRVPVSGIVPRQAFRPVGEDAVYESRSLRNADAIVSDRRIDDDNEVSRLLLEVEDRADELRRSRGLSSTPGVPSSPGARPVPGSYGSYGQPRSPASPPSSNPYSAAQRSAPAASLFAAARRGDLPEAGGGEQSILSSRGGGRASGGGDSLQAASMSAAMLKQIRAGERFLRSDDAELSGYVEAPPHGMGRETEEAWEGMQSLLRETATLKGGYMRSQQELKDLHDKLARMNWALDGMGKMNLELQKRTGKTVPYKWMAMVGQMNMDLEEDRRRQGAMEMAEAKRSWAADAQKKEEALAAQALLGRTKSADLQGARAEMEAAVGSLQEELEQQGAAHAKALDTLKTQHAAEEQRLKNQHAKELAAQAREHEVAKIQLTHQRDVFHSKLLEEQTRELNEKEVVAGLASVNKDQQTTIADLQGIIQGMRELEKNNSALIEDQKAEILALQDRLRQSSDQLVQTETREFAQKKHFKAVGKENHATILSLTEDLKFLIKRREDDLADMQGVHAAEKATLERNKDALQQQLNSMRQDIFGQILRMARRLAAARLLGSSLKDKEAGTHVWETQGGRYPGVPAAEQKIKLHGTGGKVADVTREELDELKTDLEEQNGIAHALQTLIQEEKRLQEELQASRKLAEENGSQALDYKMKYQGEFAKTEAVRATKKADLLRDELVAIDDQRAPASAQSLPPNSAMSMPNPALFSPSFSEQNSLPPTLPPTFVPPPRNAPAVPV